jgi:uncharacterized membrane protein YfcA
VKFDSISGLPSSVASAVVHVAELPTTLVSGMSHLKLKNVLPRLLLPLIVTGVIGGVIGAYFITNIGGILEPIIEVYLIIMGMRILLSAFRKESNKRKIGRGVYLLGTLGGFLDATGGGGWGPVVSGTLIGLTDDAKKSIGTVNIAEFFVTLAEITTFWTFMGDLVTYAEIVIGLILGGVIAAPIAAVACKKLSTKKLLICVGLLIIIVNAYELYMFFI